MEARERVAVAGATARRLVARRGERLRIEEASDPEDPDSEGIYDRLVEPYRGELHRYCLRMLGSPHEAEDAVQEALLRAWNWLPSFEGRSSFRSWLYRIATNTSLDLIERRSKRAAPVDYEASVEAGHARPWSPAHSAAAEQEAETPDARVERRESLERALALALEVLPVKQRAVLILRESLGFSAEETGEILGATPTAVNSALQRARMTIKRKLPATRRQSRPGLEDDRRRIQVERYAQAWQSNDVDRVVSMLAEEVEFGRSGRSPRLA